MNLGRAGVCMCVWGDAGISAVLGEIPVAGAGMTEWWWELALGLFSGLPPPT